VREGTGFRPVPPWGWFLVGELAVVALAVSGLLGSFEPTAVFAIGVTTLAALVVAVRHHRPRLTWPWWAISASLAFFLVGGALRFDFHTLGNITPAVRSCRTCYRSPATAWARRACSVSRAHATGRQRHFGVILDAVIAALAILAVAWVYVIDPVLFQYHTPLAIRLVLTC